VKEMLNPGNRLNRIIPVLLEHIPGADCTHNRLLRPIMAMIHIQVDYASKASTLLPLSWVNAPVIYMAVTRLLTLS